MASGLFLMAFAPVYESQTAAAPQTCSYTAFRWHAETARAVRQPRVVRDYASLGAGEIDTVTGCTICEEDQVVVSVPPLAPFRMCHVLAEEVGAALTRLLDAEQPVSEVTGYRVGRTRGPLDSLGFRTEFSSHAFGIAIDVNPRQNGFYHRCVQFGPDCRLMQGGRWRPGQPGTLVADGPIVRELKRSGLLWGGEILGTQKDFMHFSPTGF